jgi:predicted RNase H-like HicB family nuclease
MLSSKQTSGIEFNETALVHQGIMATQRQKRLFVCYNMLILSLARRRAAMTMYVLIENELEGGYTASLIGWPDITAQGASEDEALSHLRGLLTAHLAHAKLVPLELPAESPWLQTSDVTIRRYWPGLLELPAESPWLQTAGMFKDEPFADEFQELIAAYRRERDTQDGSPNTQDQAA